MDASKFVFIAVPFLLLLGCSTVTPASFRAKAPSLSQSWPGSVSVTPEYSEQPQSRFNANGFVFEANLDRFSEQLAGLVTQSLKESGTTIGPGGRSIQIQVVYLDFMFQGPCLIDYRVTLGNDSVFGDQATGESSNFATACTQALERAVQQIAGDFRTDEYLGGQ